MKKWILEFLAVAVASGFAGMLRFAIGLALYRPWFPIGTFVINVTGSFILGFFMASMANRVGLSPTMKEVVQAGVAVGFVGTYTTFSSYMYETDRMAAGGFGLRAILYLVGTLALGLVAVRMGVVVGKRF